MHTHLDFTLLCFSNLTLLIYDLCLRFVTIRRVRILETAAHCTSVSHVTQTVIPSPVTACSLTGTHGLTCSHKVELSLSVLFFNLSLVSANLIQIKNKNRCQLFSRQGWHLWLIIITSFWQDVRVALLPLAHRFHPGPERVHSFLSTSHRSPLWHGGWRGWIRWPRVSSFSHLSLDSYIHYRHRLAFVIMKEEVCVLSSGVIHWRTSGMGLSIPFDNQIALVNGKMERRA